jgi:hypothetical protein
LIKNPFFPENCELGTRENSTFETPRFGARAKKCSFSATNEPFFDRLDIFSDAIDLKNTLVLLFLRHLHPIIDFWRWPTFFSAGQLFFLMKIQESCPSLAGELTYCIGGALQRATVLSKELNMQAYILTKKTWFGRWETLGLCI